MRTASLVITLFLLQFAQAGFFVEDSLALRLVSCDELVFQNIDLDSLPYQPIVNVDRCAASSIQEPAALVVWHDPEWYYRVAELHVAPANSILLTGFVGDWTANSEAANKEVANLTAQLSREVKKPKRELADRSAESKPVAIEEFAIQMIVIGLVGSLWVYGRKHYSRPPMLSIFGILRELETEIVKYKHEQFMLDQVLQILIEFHCEVTVHGDSQIGKKTKKKDLLAHELVRKIAVILRRHPVKPSRSRSIHEHFTYLLFELRESRLSS